MSDPRIDEITHSCGSITTRSYLREGAPGASAVEPVELFGIPGTDLLALFVSAKNGHKIIVVDGTTLEDIRSMNAVQVWGRAVSSDGTEIYTSYKAARSFLTATGKPGAISVKKAAKDAMAIAVSDDRRRVAVNDNVDTRTLRIMDASTGATITEIANLYWNDLYSVGKYVATTVQIAPLDDQCEVVIADWETGAVVSRLRTFNDEGEARPAGSASNVTTTVRGASTAFGAVVVTDNHTRLALVEVPSGNTRMLPEVGAIDDAHPRRAWWSERVLFTPSGDRFVHSASSHKLTDGCKAWVFVYDTASGREVGRLELPMSDKASVAISDDGRRVVALASGFYGSRYIVRWTLP